MSTNDQPHAEVTEEMRQLAKEVAYISMSETYDKAAQLLADFVSKREVAAIASCTEEEAATGDHNLVPSLQAEISAITAQVVKLTERVEKAEVELYTMRKTHRWNIEKTDDGLRFCEGTHEKCADCEWEEFVKRSTYNDLRQLATRLVFFAQCYADKNPIWHNSEGTKQDPCGVHRALADARKANLLK